MTARASVRSLLLCDYVMRILSGVVYIGSVERAYHDPEGGLALILLFLSRITYGITLHSFGVSSIWAGVRMASPAKPVAILMLSLMLSLLWSV